MARKNRSSKPYKEADLTIIESGNSFLSISTPSARDFIIADLDSGDATADEM